MPWSLKLINGAVMDRWSFPPMGRRRPWVLLSQLGLCASLVVMAFVSAPSAGAFVVIALGVGVNVFGAFQDAAVDGMAIDIFPETEYARANGVMWGAKTIGIAGSSAISAWLLNAYGWSVAFCSIAALVASIFLLPLFLLERPGERRLPWTRGKASAFQSAPPMGAWLPLIRRLFRSATAPFSIRLIAIIFIALLSYGLFISTMPVLTVQLLDWSDTDFSHVAAAANFAAGMMGIFVAGPLADRFGPMRTLMATLALVAILHGAVALVPSLWPVRQAMIAYTVLYELLFVQMSVALYALAMNASDKEIAASHFALFMAFINLGTSVGAGALGLSRQLWGFSGTFAAMAAAAILALLLSAAYQFKNPIP